MTVSTDYNSLERETIINFDASTLTGTYQKISGSGFTNPGKAFKIYNSSSSLVALSSNGIPPTSLFIFDIQTNADGTGGRQGVWQLKKGEDIYARTISNTDRLLVASYF
jgi:hypothetical protein